MNHVQLDHRHHRSSNTRFPLCYLIDNMQSPENIGSLFRAADALGIERIFLSGRSATPPHPKIKKTARATEQHVQFSYEAQATQIIFRLKEQGYKIVALEITDDSTNLLNFTVAAKQKICLILGEEKRGICRDLLQLCDEAVHIPMLGINSSMNVAMACSIASFEITKKMAMALAE